MSELANRTTGSLEALRAIGGSAETLWARIAPGRSPGALRRILFVGAEHGTGTSTSACCAALGLVRNLQAKVALVELGVGPSTLAKLVGLPEGPGLHELLCSGASLRGCINGCGVDGLSLVTAGRGSLPAGQLASEHARGVFEQLGLGQDFLLVDCPPLQAHPELQPILLHVDEAVLVFEAERTQRERARELQELVSRAGVRVLGSVLNRVKPAGSR
jgi:Mrp family chromosome partitioning ATPase